jgi:glycerophosphoryl diester phosphodiesterase
VRRLVLLCAAALAAAAPAAASAAPPDIHAHRGGPFVDGKARYAENGMPAFRAAAKAGFALELDIGVTQDGVPVVLHDSTLDRTTTCTGKLSETTVAALRDCPNDIVGSPGSSLGGKASTQRTPVPTLASVLAMAKRSKVLVNAELKDFDADGSRVAKALDVIAAAKLRRDRLIVQSFLPPNLDQARRRIPNVATSRLVGTKFVEDGLKAAIAGKERWVSPQWPVSASYVRRAHRAKVKVVVWTVNRASHARAARKAGVDGIISDDPTMVRRALRR